MDYYGNNDWRDYLAHHGILGMKWGKRNGPPYPISAEGHSASEKKAGWRSSLSSGSDPSRRRKVRNGNIDEDALPDASDKEARKRWLTTIGKSEEKQSKLKKEINDKIMDLHTGDTKNKKYEKIKSSMRKKRDALRAQSEQVTKEADKELNKMVSKVLKSMRLKDLESVPKERQNEFKEKLKTEADNNMALKQLLRRVHATDEQIQRNYDTHLRKAAKVALRELGFPVDAETIAVMEDFLFL